MKNPQSKAKPKNAATEDPKQLPPATTPPEQPAPQQGQDKSKRSIMLPTDAAGQRRAVKGAYLDKMGANVFAAQTTPLVEAPGGVAELFVAAVKESVQPRDAIEEMLLMQMAWTHARLARLSAIASNQTTTANVRVVHDACDRAASTFRRQMLALADYRRPPRTDAFTVVKQLNAAQQQLVNNAQAENPAKPVTSNEVGSTPAKALPPYAEGIDFAATVGPAKQAVGVEYRTQDQGGEGSRQQERGEAR